MKVILLQDVAKIGKRFEVVDVPNGYALNKLLPQGLAENASSENVKKVQARAAKMEADESAVASRFAQALKALEGKTVEVKVEVNEQGHMFEALKPAAIVAALKESGAEVSEKEVVISTPIKEAGEHTILLKEGTETANVVIAVVAA